MPAWIKIIIIPILNVLFFTLPHHFTAGFIVVQFILACVAGFSIREQIKDIKPVLYYAMLLYTFRILTQLFSHIFINGGVISAGSSAGIAENIIESIKRVLCDASLLFMLAKLFCIIQSASLMFKTSTSLEIREGIGTIESVLRKLLHAPKKNTVTDTISLFVCFIPMVYGMWNQVKKAWYARRGSVSVKMYVTLLPVLFSAGMKKAYAQAKAITARS